MSNHTSTTLQQVSDSIMPLLTDEIQKHGISLSAYGKQCALSAINSINELMAKERISWNDPRINMTNIHTVLLHVAILQVHPNAYPRECYFMFRNGDVVYKDGKQLMNGNYPMRAKVLELGIEGDGNDAILSRSGTNVEMVYPYWAVREGDKFVYPRYQGVDNIVPPAWEPVEHIASDKFLRVVYPVKYTDGTIVYHIAERADVIRNLQAHISRNMQNETFGKGKSIYAIKDNAKLMGEVQAEKDRLFQLVDELNKAGGIDFVLDCKELRPWIHDTYAAPHSREAMILRKLRNNAIKKIPKTFESSFVSAAYNSVVNAGEMPEEIVTDYEITPLEIDIENTPPDEPEIIGGAPY